MSTPAKAREIFDDAREIGDPGGRAAFIHARCEGDAALLAEVESLLAADAEAGEFLRTSSSAAATIVSPSRSAMEAAGQMIGRYKLLQMIGEGGFGSVWMAEQKEPVKRRVALKIIKLGMDTRQVVARFEAERQALAVMDHPNIARVLDAGATETGRPFFVMELVKGEPLTEYCDRHNYSISQRLDLFVQVCKAVQHAHQKGIIHRDLKPGNVLVATQDGAPHAKVIDFGIAKAISRQLTEKTLFTEHRQLIGTPEYMSPEQAEGSLDIDTRTDVYSLGVLLYELLTGSTPFDSRSLRSAAYGEIQRIIREVEPPRPSTRLSQSMDTLASVAARRHIEPRRLGTIIRGELDWIVMKCLEKDRQRRYETADGLALDLQRYLAGEAVAAAPPSRLYRVRKVVRKNKGPFAAAAVVALALILGFIGTSLALSRALRAEAELTVQLAETAKAQQAEKARADELRLVADFQSNMLAQVDPIMAGVRLTEDVNRRFAAAMEQSGVPESERPSVASRFRQDWLRVNATDAATALIDATIMKPAAMAIDAQFGDQPLVRAQLHQSLANRYLALGLYDAAMPLQTNAFDARRELLGEDHPGTLESMSALGLLLHSMGRFAEADAHFSRALERRRRVLGEDHPDTLSSINFMGFLRSSQGRIAEAEAYHDEALAKRRRVLGEAHPDTIISLGNRANILFNAGRFAEAEILLREALEMGRRVQGADHPTNLRTLNTYALSILRQGRFAEAEPLYLESLAKHRRVMGDDHPLTLIAINSMGFLYQAQGRVLEAEPYFREALARSRRVLGEDHPDTVVSINNMGGLFWSMGKFSEVEPHWREAFEKFRRLYGDEHPSTVTVMQNLAGLLRMLGRLSEAEPLQEAALEKRRRLHGESHPDTLASVIHSGMLRFQQGRYDEAISLLAPAEPLFRSTFTGGNLWRVAGALSTLGRARVGLGYDAERFRQAEMELLEAHPLFVSTRGAAHAETISCVQGLVDLYSAWEVAEPGKGHSARAEEWQSLLQTAP